MAFHRNDFINLLLLQDFLFPFSVYIMWQSEVQKKPVVGQKYSQLIKHSSLLDTHLFPVLWHVDSTMDMQQYMSKFNSIF
jgi:hypothetical protein